MPQHSRSLLYWLHQRHRPAAAACAAGLCRLDRGLSGGRWHIRPRNNDPRIGRILIARGRDAADVPLTLTFGPSTLVDFRVTTEEVMDQASERLVFAQCVRRLGSSVERLGPCCSIKQVRAVLGYCPVGMT